MKKFFIVFFLALIVFAGIYLVKDPVLLRSLFQRKNLSDVEKHVEPVQEKTYSGTLKSLGSFSVPDSGSHFLELDDRSTLLLIGLGVDLNRYIGMKVEVHGRLTSTPSGKELLQVLNASVVPPESSTIMRAELTSYAWSLLQSGDLGISFQRRDAWEITIDDDSIRLRLLAPKSDLISESEDKFNEDVIVIEKLSNPKQLLLESYPDVVLYKRPYSVNKIGPDALTGYQFSNDDGSVDLFIARGEDSVYRLQYIPSEKRSGDQHRNDFYEFLSTFRFIPFS